MKDFISRVFAFKPLNEAWTMYSIGVGMGVGTGSGDWQQGLATGIAVYLLLSVLNWIFNGGK